MVPVMILFMAVVKFPLHSQEVRGSVGQSVVFRKKNRGSVAYSYYYPGSRRKITPSISQVNQRNLYRVGAYGWPHLSASERGYYTNLSKNFSATGYNLFMGDFLAAVPCASLGLLKLAQARFGFDLSI